MGLSAALRPITELDRALSTFLDHPSTYKEFDALARPHLRRYGRRFGAGLPADVRTEIVNETIVGLLQAPAGAFDPHRGSAHTFWTYEARHAARRVRARYAAPGRMTRISKLKADAIVRAAEAETARPTECPEPDLELIGAARFPGRGGSQAHTYGLALHAETAAQAAEILAKAPIRVRTTLMDTYYEGKSLRQVASDMGVNHGTLSREINVFFEGQRAAA
jgi:DNA-directed RNA polymerase specialized sigma24 family protein